MQRGSVPDRDGCTGLRIQWSAGSSARRQDGLRCFVNQRIDCFGNIYEGRDIRFKGEHVREHNTGTIGIVLLENLAESPEGGDTVATVKSLLDAVGYGKRPVVPTAQMQSTEKVIGILREFFGITALGGHREFPDQAGDGKICPGNIGLDLVKQLRSTTGLAAP
jgi:hypothetical protein